MGFHTDGLVRNTLRNIMHMTRDDRPTMKPAPWEMAPSLGGFRMPVPPIYRHIPHLPEYIPPSIEKAELRVAAGKPPNIEDADVDSEWARKRKLKGTDVLVLPKKKRCKWIAPHRLTESQKKDRALAQLREIIEWAGPEYSGLAQKLVEADTPAVAETTVSDAFARATGTNHNHIAAFMMYTRWCTLTGFSPFPFVESVLYKYLCELRVTGAPATRADSFVTTMTTMHKLLELPGVVESLKSERVKQLHPRLHSAHEKNQKGPTLAG